MEIARSVGYECGAEMEKLIALRAAIAAEEVVKKVKVVKTVADVSKGERLQYRGNCQACGRNHAVVDGFVAKHGYTVEMGFFNGVCTGHRYAPMQISVDHTESVIAMCKEEAVKSEQASKDIESGKKSPSIITKGYGRNKIEIPFAEGTPREQSEARDQMFWNLSNQARAYANHAANMEKLVVEYFGKDLMTVVV